MNHKHLGLIDLKHFSLSSFSQGPHGRRRAGGFTPNHTDAAGACMLAVTAHAPARASAAGAEPSVCKSTAFQDRCVLGSLK